MQNTRSSPSFLFAQSSLGDKERVWFLAEADDMFHLLQLKDRRWAIRTIDWPVAAIAGKADGSSYEIFGVGINGELCHGSPGRFEETQLTIVSESSITRGVLRDIRFVGNDVVVVGMNGQVFVRREGRWSDVSVDARRDDAIVGFNTVAGTSSSAFYVAGLQGQIFFFDGTDWRSVDSSTSAALTQIAMTDAERFVACGAAGTLIAGTTSSVESIPNDVTEDDFYGLAWFKGVLYVASLTDLYRVAAHGLEPVDFAFAERPTFGHLEANGDVMYSVGAHHVYATEDGDAWRLVVCDR